MRFPTKLSTLFSGNLLVRSNELENANETLQAEITQRKQTEEALRESEERFRLLAESANEAIITVDSSGKIIFWNKGAEEIFGYSADEALGKPYNLIVPERFHENHQKRMKYFISMGKSAILGKSIDGIGIRKDGRELFFETSNSLWKTKEGTFLTAIIRDITKRKEIENEIKETRNFLENIFEVTQDGIMISDPSGYIVRINRALEEMLGFTQDEIIRKHTAELAPQDENYRIIGDHLITDLIEKGFTKNFETAWLRKDGSLCPIELNVTRIVDREGNKAGAVSVIRDITERKKAEEEIKTAKDFLESVIESSRDGIMICNEKGYILSVNTALSTMSSFSKEELIGEHPSIFTIDEKDIRKKVLEKQGELFEKGSASYESISRTKEGKIINIECNSAMIKDENGNYTGGVSIVRDITERKKMEQQLIRSEKLRSLGELAGGVAHDFNNVLAAILGRAQLLSKVLDSPEGIPEKRESVHELKKGLELIEKAALDGAETVRRIQEFSRKKDEKYDTYFTEVDVNKVINDALEFTKARWKDAAESKGINIDIERNLLPVPLVSGSASELREVLTNIINNALDAMPQGGEMRVTTFRENSSVAIKIEDTGIGIPEEIKDRIFDPFFTTKGPQSTGLGMSVSYGIINRHKGIITVDSMEGKGSTFTIILPVIDERKRKEKEEESKLVTDKLKKTSVLIIDDEEAVRNLLCDILMEDGHEVEIACNGSEGIELFKRKNFDVVFTDLGMPGMSGWQVAEEIKKINKKTPVALITGWKVPQESEMMKNGVDLIVNKPFQLDQVLRLVHEGMEIRKRLGNN
jgi:PAS domain S-box-containing protein